LETAAPALYADLKAAGERAVREYCHELVRRAAFGGHDEDLSPLAQSLPRALVAGRWPSPQEWESLCAEYESARMMADVQRSGLDSVESVAQVVTYANLFTVAHHHPRPPPAGPHPHRRTRPPAALGPAPRQPRPRPPATRTAIQHADHHLATTTPDTSPEYQTARQLLHRRDQLLDHFREIAVIAAQFDAAATRSHERSRSQDHDYGLEL
jgi:hypothetical protein